VRTAQARFGVGELVRHTRFGYRGVIADVDPVYAGTEQWYHEVARSRPPRDRPWYHVLVHGESHTTYVAERHLEPDPTRQEVDHPLVPDFFDQFSGDRYRARVELN